MVDVKLNIMINCTEIIFSQRACNSIVSESIYRQPNETAGILLGTLSGLNWYVVEAIDLGLNYIISATDVSYDISYVNHLVAVLSRQYLIELEILGYWRCISKGCGALSGIDKKTNLSVDNTDEKGVISCLVNMDTTVSLTVYHNSFSLKSKEVSYKIGDHLLPEKVLKYKYEEEIRIINFNQYCRPYVIGPNGLNF